MFGLSSGANYNYGEETELPLTHMLSTQNNTNEPARLCELLISIMSIFITRSMMNHFNQVEASLEHQPSGKTKVLVSS